MLQRKGKLLNKEVEQRIQEAQDEIERREEVSSKPIELTAPGLIHILLDLITGWKQTLSMEAGNRGRDQ